jgi:hypothetical protein
LKKGFILLKQCERCDLLIGQISVIDNPAATMSTTTENNPSSPDDHCHERLLLTLRKAVRYGRSDIKASLCSKSIFRSSKPFEIELLDISTRGAHIVSKRKLSVNTAFTLKIAFNGGKAFDIAGKVIHKKSSREDSYGFQFDVYNDGLGDYLLNTQTDLIFK